MDKLTAEILIAVAFAWGVFVGAFLEALRRTN